MLEADLSATIGEPLVGARVPELMRVEALDSSDPAAALDDRADPVRSHDPGVLDPSIIGSDDSLAGLWRAPLFYLCGKSAALQGLCDSAPDLT